LLEPIDEINGGRACAAQILVVVYLADVLLPCLVTTFSVAREVSPRWALTMMLRQAVAAIGFAAVIAWGGVVVFG